MTRIVSVSEAREGFADLVNRAAYAGERSIVARRGRDLAAVVPAQDARLLEALEDELDLAAVREVLADPDLSRPIPWEDVKAQLGL
jgi:prevent-host-death family protein